MMEDFKMRPMLRCDPSVNSHTPSSGRSQGISHVLGSIFKDLFSKDIIGKDTVSNLIQTKKGKDSYHDKCVEELQQAHAEYNHSIKETDMLESHIIQARTLAAAKEREVLERMKEEIGDFSGYQGLRTVESAFSWCIDQDLLTKNNLISPRDYMPPQKPRKKVPPPDAVKSTLAHTNAAKKTERTTPETNESDLGHTVESRPCTPKLKKTTTDTKAKPRWKDQPSAKEREEGLQQLEKLKERQRFRRNPRFLPPILREGGTTLSVAREKLLKIESIKEGMAAQSPSEDSTPVFLANPPALVFNEYIVGHVYESTLELKNLTTSSRNVRVFPPNSPHFSLGLGRFPGEGGVIAPGMSCKYTVRFAPDSLADYQDSIVVDSQAEHLLVVPIEARRPPPVLTLPRVLDCGYCLVGGVKCVEFICKNIGLSPGSFCIVPKGQLLSSNIRSLVRPAFSERPPFAVSPSFFSLPPGGATVVEVLFFPTTAEKSCRVFTIICDNCQVKDISIKGEGQVISLELVSVSGEEVLPEVGDSLDVTADHFVRFSPCNPHAVMQKRLVVSNNVHLELPFHWQITKPNLPTLLPGEAPNYSHIQLYLADDDAFHVSPLSGVLLPCQDQEFIITFSPKELKDYHSMCHLVLKEVPELPLESADNCTPPSMHMASKVSNVIVMEIEVKGSAVPYQILLEPYALFIPGEISVSTTACKQFKMWNHSRARIFFSWEKMNSNCHRMEVVPSTGQIEENECFDFNLNVTGGKPEKVVTTLVCHIKYCPQPVTLVVEVTFKGPRLTLSEPSVDFGLMRFGEQTKTTLLVTNVTQLEASWRLQEVHISRQGQRDTEVFMEPCRGVLPPLESCSVDILFRPTVGRHFETELELIVENGNGCHLIVRADVQSPQVCLLNCQLVLTEVYSGVPAKGVATLFNQTLLPSNFRWKSQLQGRQAPLCTATFHPSSGCLGPNGSMEITVSITSRTDVELREVVAVCEVEGMNSPVVLRIVVPIVKKLSVSYSLPGDSWSPESPSPSPVVLNFGDDVVVNKPAVKQLLITNQTAIPAHFAIRAEYFTCHPSKPPVMPDQRSENSKKPSHAAQAGKLAEKAFKDFVSGLLAHGKGAAFFMQPHKGMLGAFETQSVSVTAYTEMWGDYSDYLICRVGELEPTLIPMKMTVTGCPLFFKMTGQRLENQNQGPVMRFGTCASGGDTVTRSLRINNPTMFDIRMEWEIYNIDPSDQKLLDLLSSHGIVIPIKDSDGVQEVRAHSKPSTTAKGGSDTPDKPDTSYNSENPDNSDIPDNQDTPEAADSPASQGTNGSARSQSTADEPSQNSLQAVEAEQLEEHVVEEEEESQSQSDVTCKEKKPFSVGVRPHMGSPSDFPYCITPQQILIPAKCNTIIYMSFTPLTLHGSVFASRCVGLALGFMTLETEMAVCVPGKVSRLQGLDLEPLRMNLLGVVKPTLLLAQMEESDSVLEFHAAAGDLLKMEKEGRLPMQQFDIMQTFELTNISGMPLEFTLEIQPPFVVVKPQPQPSLNTASNSSLCEGQSLLLRPRHRMKVKVAFHCSSSMLDHGHQKEEKMPPGITVIHKPSGQKQLRFDQSLHILHSKNSPQAMPLRAHLDLHMVRLSCESLDFGPCALGQAQVRVLQLHSEGACSCWEAVIESEEEEEEEDPQVFTVTPKCGKFVSTSCIVNLKLTFSASEEREFKATLVIKAPLVRENLRYPLLGTGSDAIEDD